MKVILASASSSRTTLLQQAGIPHDVEISGVDEESEQFSVLSPSAMVVALAESKARAVAAAHADENVLVIGADSTLEFEGAAMAKPELPEVALAWWKRYVGKKGLLHTGQAVIDVAKSKIASSLSTTEITFANISEEEMRAYIDTKEPLFLAGGASLDGIGAPYIAHINGDATGVLGLSMNHLRALCEELGFPWRTLRVNAQ